MIPRRTPRRPPFCRAWTWPMAAVAVGLLPLADALALASVLLAGG